MTCQPVSNLDYQKWHCIAEGTNAHPYLDSAGLIDHLLQIPRKPASSDPWYGNCHQRRFRWFLPMIRYLGARNHQLQSRSYCSWYLLKGVKNPKLPIEKLRTGGTIPGRSYRLDTWSIVPSPPSVMIKSISCWLERVSSFGWFQIDILLWSLTSTLLVPVESSGAAIGSIRTFVSGCIDWI